MTILTIYFLIGSIIAITVLLHHVTGPEPCCRNALHHSVYAILVTLLWPVFLTTVLYLVYFRKD